MRQGKYDWEEVEKIIEKYSSILYKIAYSYTGSKEDSEDVLQEVFIKYARQGTFQNEEHKKSWLIRVTINCSINVVKSSHRKKTVALEGEENKLISKNVETESEIKTIVMELPIKYRAAIYLYYYEGYKVEEIAAVLNKKPASIYTLLNRGRALLRKILEEGGSNNE